MTASRYFEDVRVGEQIELGDYEFTAENIKEFAAKFDPQSFHLDEEAAKHSMFGALCASGWHTSAACMKVLAEYHLGVIAKTKLPEGARWPRPGPSAGFTDLVWARPVYAGDRLTFRQRILDKSEMKSRPEWGLVTTLHEGINQNGDLAFAFTNHIFYERRNQGS